MHDGGLLSLQLQFCGKQRQSGRSIGALNRHSQKSGRLVENDYGIVFVKHGNRPGETRPAPAFVNRSPIRLSRTAAGLSGNFLHWLDARRSGHYQTIPAISQTSDDVASLRSRPSRLENNPQSAANRAPWKSLIRGGDCPSRYVLLLAIMDVYYGCAFGQRCGA